MLKIVTFVLFIGVHLFAQCRYNVLVRIDPSEHIFNVWADLNSSEPITFENITDYPIRDLDDLQKKLSEGTKSVSFEYRAHNEELIGDDFVMLLGGWLPRTGKLCGYNTRVVLPKGFEAVMENEHVRKRDLPGITEFIFTMERPIDDITIIASSSFAPKSQTYNGIEIMTYFFKKDAHLSNNYIKKSIGYIRMYESLVGPFPYKKFAVVENSFQTGNSMPTFTLVGDQVISQPYMVERSLAHEILHQWFGNAVFNDFSKGNWCEGLTTYLSDHYVRERDGQGAAYRKKTLNDFMDSVTPQNDFPLAKFHHRDDRASMSIGYGKGMYFFHMLRIRMGEKAFSSALKEFYRDYASKKADYGDMAKIFSRFAQKDMRPYFSQWLYNTGMIDLEVENLFVKPDKDRHLLSFTIHQKNKKTLFTFPLSFLVVCDGTQKEEKAFVEGLTQKFEFSLACRPKRVVFDPRYDLFRTLGKEEKMLTIGSLEGVKGFIVAGAQEADEAMLMEMFDVERFITVEELTPEIVQEYSVIFVNAAKKAAYGKTDAFEPYTGDLTLQVVKNPQNSAAAWVLLEYKAQELGAFASRLKYYKSYSKIAVDGHKSTMKKVSPSGEGMVIQLEPPE